MAFNTGAVHSENSPIDRLWSGAASPIPNDTPCVCIYTSYNPNSYKEYNNHRGKYETILEKITNCGWRCTLLNNFQCLSQYARYKSCTFMQLLCCWDGREYHLQTVSFHVTLLSIMKDFRFVSSSLSILQLRILNKSHKHSQWIINVVVSCSLPC